MNKSDVIYLISQTYNKDAISQYIATESKREVFANISSISASEWFEAGRSGLQAEYRITMFKYDYHGEKIVEIDGRRYGVYRTYSANSDEIELYVEEKAGLNEQNS